MSTGAREGRLGSSKHGKSSIQKKMKATLICSPPAFSPVPGFFFFFKEVIWQTGVTLELGDNDGNGCKCHET